MVQSVIANMRKKTGRSLDEWIGLLKTEGPATEKERTAWLKTHHKLGTNYAGWIAGRAAGKGTEEEDPEAYLEAAERYVDAMSAGATAGLRPTYDALLRLGLSTPDRFASEPEGGNVPPEGASHGDESIPS